MTDILDEIADLQENIRPWLMQISRDVEDALENARQSRKMKKFADWTVNWADLHCTDCEICLPECGDWFFRVKIEESSPTEFDLLSYVEAHLKSRHHDISKIAIVLRW